MPSRTAKLPLPIANASTTRMPHRKLRTTAVAFSFAFLAMLVQLSAHAQAQSPAPTIHVYSRETLVDVSVTDDKGTPIHNLKRSDFTLTEDDKPRSIRGFEEVSADAPAATAPPRKLPPNVFTNFQPSTGPLNVLLLDYINGTVNGTAATLARATRYIKTLPPGTQGTVLGLGNRLTILQSPTADHDLLLKAVLKYVEPFAAAADPCGTQIAANWAILDQLDQVATYLSGINGRKNLIWVSTGIPSIVFPPQHADRACALDMEPALRKTYELLADAQVTVYPVDPTGVGNLGQRQLAMEAVAEATGGIAYYETNDIGAAIVQAVESGASYYTISYAPRSTTYDGQHHTINITVNRPGAHLLYRKGYYADDPAQLARTTASTLSAKPEKNSPDKLALALAPYAPPATQLLFNVRADIATEPPMPFDPLIIGALNPKLKKAPLTRYNFLFSLAQDQIAFADAGAGTYSGALEFDLAANDTDGRLVTMRSQTLKLSLTSDEYRQFIQTPFQFLQQLDLPPGQLTIRAGVRDIVSDKIGTLNIPLTVHSGAP